MRRGSRGGVRRGGGGGLEVQRKTEVDMERTGTRW